MEEIMKEVENEKHETGSQSAVQPRGPGQHHTVVGCENGASNNL